jgi:hypothetical protein
MKEVLGGTLNVAILSVFYVLVGGVLSYVLGYIFDDFDKVWKSRSVGYQLAETGLELTIFGTIAFWISKIIRDAAPIFPVSKEMDIEVDSYISGLFFAYAMFLFLDHLTSKIKHIYEKLLGPGIKKILPDGGYLLDGTLHFTRKTDTNKLTESEHRE